jgi:hypothetical protein
MARANKLLIYRKKYTQISRYGKTHKKEENNFINLLG